MNSREMTKVAVAALEDRKANNIKIIDISAITTVGDYIVVADASNKSQLQALCDNVEEHMSEVGATLKNREGYANGGWILLDYYDIIVHVFHYESRSFYDLEHIWRDGIIIPVGEL